MLVRVWLVELLIAVAFVASGSVNAANAGAATGTVTGVVYWDRNANGSQDAGEPGFETNPVLTAPDSALPLVTGFAGDDGRYEMQAEAGTYRFSPGVAVAFENCAAAPLPSYNPFGARNCVGADYPITSERFTEPFDLGAGETVDIDFGVTTRDEMILLGRALVDRGNAPAGTVVTASVNGVECGSATIEEGGSPGGGPDDFELRILGAGQRDGCAEQGDLVTIAIGDVASPQSNLFVYVPFSPVPNPAYYLDREGVMIVDLAFFRDYAWVFSDDRTLEDGSPVPNGTAVRAMVDGVLCGETVIGDLPGVADQLSGFGRLFVASDAVQPGCAAPGRTFDVVIGERGVFSDLTWEPRLYVLGTSADPNSPPPASPPSVPLPCPTPVIGVETGGTLSHPPIDPNLISPPIDPNLQSPPPSASPNPWPQSPPAATGVRALQEVPQSPPPWPQSPPGSPPPLNEPLSPPELLPPPAVIGCPVPAGAVRPPDTGSAGLKHTR